MLIDGDDTHSLRSASHARLVRGYNSSMSPTHPHPDGAKSGRVLLRMPESMHVHLSDAAGAEGVSMNLYICGILAAAIDWRGARANNRAIEQVRQEILHQTWRDRVRRGEVAVPGVR
jgi:HicB-like protein involved in pilus formation